MFRATSMLLKRMLHQKEINAFIESHRYLECLEFNDAVLEHFNFSFQVSSKDRVHIPDQNRVLIVANHPLSSLDGLALLKLISEIRSDVKIVATTLLNCIDPLQSLFLSVNNLSKSACHRNSMNQIAAALESEQAVILLSTGEISRISPLGVRDGKWKTGFLSLAKRTRFPLYRCSLAAKTRHCFMVCRRFTNPWEP